MRDPLGLRMDLRDGGSLVAPLARAGLGAPQAATDLQSDPFAPLLQAAARMSAPAGTSARARGRLLHRVSHSAAASRALHTQRLADTAAVVAASGVTMRRLYRAAATPAQQRPGEPEAVTLVELAAGASWCGPATALQREWLVLRGSVELGAVTLQEHDYHVVPAGLDAGPWLSHGGALLYQREARPEAGAPSERFTQRAEAGVGGNGGEWAEFGPGIKRRVLWQQAGQAAMLYHALPGAAVPHHGHGHDEECLMLGGDLFLDEVLLRPLDYQIAPAGTEHGSVSTDTGALLFAHGDVELDLKAG